MSAHRPEPAEGGVRRGESTADAVPQLGIGQVRHARLRPTRHGFHYGSYFLRLPMRQLRRAPSRLLARNRWGLLAFHDADHGDGRADSLACLDEQLAAAGIVADGEVWLQCLPRVLGYAFKPISFWHCHAADGALVAVVAEVNNTFGARHAYLLQGPSLGNGGETTASKVMHVSPFNTVSGEYRFRFLCTAAASRHGARTLACIDLHDDAGLLVRTSWSGRLAPLTPWRAARAFFGTPLMTLGVVWRIHWQALRLFAKGVPFHGRTPPRAAETPFPT